MYLANVETVSEAANKCLVKIKLHEILLLFFASEKNLLANVT